MIFRVRYVGKLLIVLVGVAVLGLAVMLLWNRVMPELLVGSRMVDYPHALGLLILCRILFGGFRGRGGWGGRRRWRQWAEMTAEERDEFRRRRCGPAERTGP